MSCMNASCLTPTTGVASQIFTSALQFFAASQCLLVDETLDDYKFAGDSADYERFDFIIVGSGSAGCVLANRLSEVREWNILLIEAGGDPPVESTIPRLSTSLFDTQYEWGYNSINNGITNQAAQNGMVLCPRGKMLGGTSNVNEMVYLKGNPANYREWQDEGNYEWSPEQVDCYFKKAESLQDQSLLEDPAVSKTYGRDGPLVINRFNTTYRGLTEDILVAYDQMGSPRVNDLNTANLLGSGIYTVTAANGIRQSSNRDYLNPILAERQNLKILKNTLVTKVLIDEFNVAYGVEAEIDGETMFYYANREVILSAGVINSPQLLMLSGVGPREDLEVLDIPCKVDSPYVGKNLQAHNMVPVTIFGYAPPGMANADNQFEAIEYLYDREGHLAQSYLADILLFQTDTPNDSDPDFMTYLEIIANDTDYVGPILSRLTDSVVDSVKQEHVDHTLFAFYFSLQHPHSRGTVTLSSKNPREYPIINLNIFEDPRDLRLAVKGIKQLTKVLDTDYFRSINAYLGRLKWRPCDTFELDSEGYWECICKNMVTLSYHLVGTSKMGPDCRNSVVDSRLRVHGIANLRVVDEGIMPTITTGSTDGPVVMIGERAADIIKEDNRRPEEIISVEVYRDEMPYIINEPYPVVEEEIIPMRSFASEESLASEDDDSFYADKDDGMHVRRTIVE